MTIPETVKKIISETIGTPINEIQESSHLVDDLNAQNLEIADLISALEQKFHLEIPQGVVENFKTIGDIVIYIADHTDSFDE